MCLQEHVLGEMAKLKFNDLSTDIKALVIENVRKIPGHDILAAHQC